MSGRPDPLDPVEAVDPLTVTPAEVVPRLTQALNLTALPADMLLCLVSAGGARTR